MKTHITAVFGLGAIATFVAVVPVAAAPTTAPATAPITAPSTEPSPTAATLFFQAFALLDGLADADNQRLGLCGYDGCWVVTTPLDAGTASLISRQKQAIDLARAAATMPKAQWNITSDAARMVEITNKAGRLSALLVLQARHELRDGQPNQAIDDLFVAFAFSRHVADEPLLMTKMCEGLAWRPVAELLASQLQSMPKDLLGTLPQRLKALPPSATMDQVIHGEYEFAKLAAAKKGFAMSLMVIGLKDYYQALADAGLLAPDQFDKVVDNQTLRHSINPWAKVLSPSLKNGRVSVAVLEAKRAMLETAIDVVLKGEASLKDSKDPFGDGPFLYRKLPHGFELESKLLRRDEPVKLVIQ